MFVPASTESAGFKRSAAMLYPRDLLPVWTAGAAFLIDIKTPNGVIDGFLYVLAVLACVWVPRVRCAPYTALGVTLPMIFGFALSPGDELICAAVVNRLVGLLAVWATALVVWRHARLAANGEAVMADLQRRVSVAEQASHKERMELSTWLKREIGRELEIVDWQIAHLPHHARRSADVKGEALVLRRVIERAQQSVRGKAMRLLETEVASCDGSPRTSSVWLRIDRDNRFAWNDLEPFVGA